jgi:hypothetical protein
MMGFSPPQRIQTGYEADSTSYPTATGALIPEDKRPGREADQSPSSTTEVQNKCVELHIQLTNTPSWRGA